MIYDISAEVILAPSGKRKNHIHNTVYGYFILLSLESEIIK